MSNVMNAWNLALPSYCRIVHKQMYLPNARGGFSRQSRAKLLAVTTETLNDLPNFIYIAVMSRPCLAMNSPSLLKNVVLQYVMLNTFSRQILRTSTGFYRRSGNVKSCTTLMSICHHKI